MNDLITIEKKSALDVFATENVGSGIDPYLKKIRQQIDAFVPDVTTNKGRKEIASMAHKVAQSKTYLDGIGKELTAEYKRIPALIDNNRRHVRDTLDKWKEEVREPLTAWEESEKARVDGLRHKLNELSNAGEQALQNWMSLSIDYLCDRLAEVKAETIGDHWQEFVDEAAKAKDASISALESAIEKRRAYDAEQAELSRLRKEAEERAAKEQQEKEERERREREERIAKEAEARAKAEAEAEEKLRLERIESERKAAILEKEEAELRAKEAEERAEREKREAVEAERKRAEQERVRQEQLEKSREADRAHRAKINNQVKQCFIAGGMAEEMAKLAVKLIAKGGVAHTQIRY